MFLEKKAAVKIHGNKSVQSEGRGAWSRGRAAIYAKRNRKALIGQFLKQSIKTWSAGGEASRFLSDEEPNEANLQTFSVELYELFQTNVGGRSERALS